MKRKTKLDMIDALQIGFIMVCIMVAGVVCSVVKHSPQESTVKINGKNGQCSGVQIQTKSGSEYILSAGHCAHLSDDDKLDITTEDGRHLIRRIVAEDMNSDLLLIEAVPGLRSLKIADTESLGESVETFTHGAGLATYKTSGELVQFKEIEIPMFEILSGENLAKCQSAPKYKVIALDPFGLQLMCVMHLDGVVSTAQVVPGSSGGMVVHADKLVGVVSATDGHFGYFVTVKDIHSFVDSY